MVFNKIDDFQYIKKDDDDLTPIKKDNLSLEYWQKTWMAKDNDNTIFISCTKKINIKNFKEMLYQIISKIQRKKYPYNNFLY